MFSCFSCGKEEIGNITCPNGHYICDACHGKGAFDVVKDYVLETSSVDAFAIAEELMAMKDKIPMLGCENAWIATGALMAALKNEGSLHVTDAQIIEALNRTHRQAIGGYCGLTGICGIVLGIGACFSVLLGAACPKNVETEATMRVVGRIVEVIADNTGPCCCKAFVRVALAEAIALAQVCLGVSLPGFDSELVCSDFERHPHGCRKDTCSYYHGTLR